MPKSPVPGMGFFAMCMDTEGNVFGIWEENKEAQ
jgi:predicted enzyme related to lactoylglutathione lyase